MLIYCVEDDAGIRELVVYTLNNVGFEAVGFSCAEDLYKAIHQKLPSLFLLDIMLPGEDGISILKKLRSKIPTKDLPVIMLTAKGSEFDKISGLDSGADDYITKPFGIMELVSRIKAVLRRAAPVPEDTLTIGRVTLSPLKHMVTVDGESVLLTIKEFELLELLMKNKGVVLARDRITAEIWGYDFDGETRTVDVHIRTLRQKLGAGGEIIETIRGIGYKAAE
ncbi:MAG: response regulator transcription factor [Oscillospiraceae bacterium]|jgi:two-component system alkaline phosphatase synthesis response regulator PhoP|nr:response regulator transcription factor [Oscillospiraceae bacterium]